MIARLENHWNLIVEKLALRWHPHAMIKRIKYHINWRLVGEMAQGARQFTLQLGIYAMILTGAVGVTYTGCDVLMLIIHDKMVEMSQEVIQLNAPKSIETASLRTTID